MTVGHLISNKMAERMVLFCFSFILSVVGSYAAGQFSIAHFPSSLIFKGDSEVLESSLKDVYSAALGLSVGEDTRWNGLRILDPFSTPEAVVEVFIDGIDSLADSRDLKFKSYPLKVDEYESDTYEALKQRIKQHSQHNASTVLNINLLNTEQMNDLKEIIGAVPPVKPKKPLVYLKTNVEEDYQFLVELESLKAFTEKVNLFKPDNSLDFITIRFSSLHPLSDFHGPYSAQAKEAKGLLVDALKSLSQAFTKVYDGRVLVAVVTNDVEHTRRAIRAVNLRTSSPSGSSSSSSSSSSDGSSSGSRSDTSDTTTVTEEDKKPRAAPLETDFTVMFNLFLWFGVVFFFSLVAVVYAIMDMDPGRDSIIYRMTNTRLKKEN